VTVQGLTGPVVSHRGARVGTGGGFLARPRNGTPASKAVVMKAWRRLCGKIRLVIPARRAIRFPGPLGGVAVHPSTGWAQEDRPDGTFTDALG
jgi:hypothetical protein